MKRLPLAPLILAVASLVVTGAGAAGSKPSLVAEVGEWSIVPSSGAIPAGRVRVVVRNLGTQTHELTIVRTARFAQALPLSGTTARIHELVRPVLVRPGRSRTFSVRLQAGSYALVDNLPWHYWKGTWAAFVVR